MMGGKLTIDAIHTNTVEGYYSIFKRGMKGVYQHARKSTCTVTLPSSISVTTLARRSDTTITCVPR
jgi:hypothetical protein